MADELDEVLKSLADRHPETEREPENGGLWDVYIDEDGREVARRNDNYFMAVTTDMINACGISEAFMQKSFDNFESGNNPALINAKRAAVDYAENFERIEHSRNNGLMLCGQVGSGKSHLGVAICRELLKKRVRVLYMPYVSGMTDIKQKVTDETLYNAAMRKYKTARVLYIDDFLKSAPTDADRKIIYELVNYRYMNNLPVMLSSEKMPSEIIQFDEATGTRLAEMARGRIICLKGRELNYRMRFDC